MRSRRTKVIFVVIAILAVAGVTLMHVEFSRPELKNAITSRLSTTLGIPVSIEKVSVKLSQGIRVKNLSLGFEEAEILSVDGIILRYNLLEMLRKQFNVRSVVVERPVLTLQRDQIAFLLLPLILTSQQPSTGSSGFKFWLARAEVHNGEVILESKGSGSLTVDEIDLEISSEGEGEPVVVKADGKMEAFDFSVLGSYDAGGTTPVSFKITTDIDWSNLQKDILEKLNLERVPDLKGTGTSRVDITLKGSPDELSIDVSGDLTENDFSCAGLFHKPGGLPAKLDMSSVYSSGKSKFQPGKLDFSAINVELGRSRLSSTGFWDIKEKNLYLKAASDSIIISELAQCIPALKNFGAAGEVKLKLEISKRRGETRVDDVVAIIGDGRLTGSGEILKNGKYELSMKGENIDIEKFFSVKQEGGVRLDMSGKARMQTRIHNSGRGPEGLNGEGNFQIQSGVIESFSWLGDLFSAIHLHELMPFRYTNITGSFSITDGKMDIKEMAIYGKDAILKTEEGKIDLIKKTKNISADFALAPHLVKRQRAKFKQFDRFFHVDEDGFAHLSIVWSGPLSKGTPDLTASLLKTGMEKYGNELLKKLLGEDED